MEFKDGNWQDVPKSVPSEPASSGLSGTRNNRRAALGCLLMLPWLVVLALIVIPAIRLEWLAVGLGIALIALVFAVGVVVFLDAVS